MHEKVCQLIEQWENELQQLTDLAATCQEAWLIVQAQKAEDKATELRKRIDQLRELVKVPSPVLE